MARSLAAARCAWAVTCLTSPGRVVVAAGGEPDPRAVWFARALGARDLAQGLVTLAAPTRRVLAGGVVVDGLHSVSVLALAVADASRRRPALLNALTATCCALLGLALTQQQPSRYPLHGGSR